jgi:signal transduction histidine kinase
MSGSSRLLRGPTARASATRTLRLALVQITATAAVLAGVEIVMFIDGPVRPAWVLVLFASVGLEFVGVGVIAWARRPSNRTGALLCVGGLSLLLAALQNTGFSALVAVGLVFGVAPIGVLLHILLAFPSGRLGGRLPRAVVVAGYVITIGLQAPRYLFSSDVGLTGVLAMAHNPGAAHAGIVVQDSAGAVAIIITAFVLALRLHAVAGAQRVVLALVYGYGIFAILFLEAATNVLPPLFGFGPLTVFVLQISAAAGVPIAFTLGMLGGEFAPTREFEELGVWLGADSASRPDLREALASMLGDPSLELLFWLPDSRCYIGADGARRELPQVGSGRAAVEVEAGGRRVAAIAYDALLISEPELVRSAGRVTALVLEREQLTAELLASRDALQQSRARIVEAADRERRRIARDLHDGLQSRLVLLAMKAGRIEADSPAESVSDDAAELRHGLEAANDELRRLVQGVMPALLIERGLYAATEDLVDRMPMPTNLELDDASVKLPEPVESAGYFVVVEALTNAVKHSKARELAVRVARTGGGLKIEVRDDGVGGARVGAGSGLRGVADRLDVLGGRLLIDSPPGGGTVIDAEVPCAS